MHRPTSCRSLQTEKRQAERLQSFDLTQLGAGCRVVRLEVPVGLRRGLAVGRLRLDPSTDECVYLRLVQHFGIRSTRPGAV